MTVEDELYEFVQASVDAFVIDESDIPLAKAYENCVFLTAVANTAINLFLARKLYPDFQGISIVEKTNEIAALDVEERDVLLKSIGVDFDQSK